MGKRRDEQEVMVKEIKSVFVHICDKCRAEVVEDNAGGFEPPCPDGWCRARMRKPGKHQYIVLDLCTDCTINLGLRNLFEKEQQRKDD